MKKYLLLLLLIPAIWGFSQNIDINVLRDINLNRNKQLDGVFRGITNSAAPVAIGTPIVLYGIGILTKDSVTTSKSYYIGLTVLTATVLSTALKYSINRPRPFETYPDIKRYMEEVIQRALRYYFLDKLGASESDVQAAKDQLDALGIGQAQIREAQSAWYPQVGLTANTGNSTQQDFSNSLNNAAAYGLTLSQLVYDFGKIKSSVMTEQA